MQNYEIRCSGSKGLLRGLTVVLTASIALCCIGCQSMKRTETSERMIRTERIGQEVILLPESERLIVDLSTLDRLSPATEFVAPKGNSGGLTVKKRADGLIEIESRRDTVRIRGDTVCSHEYLDLDSVEERNRGRPWRPWVIVLAVFFVIWLMAKGKGAKGS